MRVKVRAVLSHTTANALRLSILLITHNKKAGRKKSKTIMYVQCLEPIRRLVVRLGAITVDSPSFSRHTRPPSAY
jgi:hypothetical protein